MLLLADEPAGDIPHAGVGLPRAAGEQDPAVVVLDERTGGRRRVRVDDEPARAALEPFGVAVEIAAQRGQCFHPSRNPTAGSMSGMPISETEFSRIGLFGSLPGETLRRLSERMRRHRIAAGAEVLDEGTEGERFYVVLSGMLTVTQEAQGERALLKPGDYFGEVALMMNVPRTASIRALTPSVVASCDRETFDEFVRPLFSD